MSASLDDAKALIVRLENLQAELNEAKADARRLLSLAYQAEDSE